MIKVRVKTKEELLASGWVFILSISESVSHSQHHCRIGQQFIKESGGTIVKGMLEYLGQEITVRSEQDTWFFCVNNWIWDKDAIVIIEESK